MNTTERIVESYFRLCRGCLTTADVKVLRGNNRQIDLLAVNIKKNEQYHVEVSVTHQQTWCPTPDILMEEFERKYFGVPAKREGKNTDWSLGKTYESQIYETYEQFGLDPKGIIRTWVCWTVVGSEGLDEALRAYCIKRRLKRNTLTILSFRDEVIPQLLDEVSTANYEDDSLRTLSLLRQYGLQTKRNKAI